ncbi:MAG: [FeFe] hydrogenase H-cluster radical SAM maturase HydG [bacterium]|nr:[FeFe] hydrogenase H-cluster radical SAM maturase HydG [bacterium]
MSDYDFIDDARLERLVREVRKPDVAHVREILAKARSITTLTLEELATLLGVEDNATWEEMAATAQAIKRTVYDNRIVTFAPLYVSNYCINNCAYCGFRVENQAQRRRHLSVEEIRAETEVLAGRIGHKRVIAVYGEHPQSDIRYLVKTLETIYSVRVPVRRGYGNIRRVNVNAAPMSVEELRELKKAGIGTYQVFQETYHHGTYAAVHPRGTRKSDYVWRLLAMHRAMEAGIEDVGIGVLFGLYDWRFEVLGLLQHAQELEKVFGVGPHTISFPRIEPAHNTPYSHAPAWRVDNATLRKIVILIRLAVPYAGMILTAREPAQVRRTLLELGVTQTDASTRIGVGAYCEGDGEQEGDRQQFLLGDTRSLDEVVRELAAMGMITSFCTAGYRCGRTGACIMELLRSGREGQFCKLNAILTFREWLDDFASDATRAVGEQVLARELEEVRVRLPQLYPRLQAQYARVAAGERDVYF